MTEKAQYIRIMKGEIGPNPTEAEANKMAQTIYNRSRHPAINCSLTNSNEYQTLNYPQHDYKLTEEAYKIFSDAYDQRADGDYDTVGWDTSSTSIKSNKYWKWTAESHKTGSHYYFTITKQP